MYQCKAYGCTDFDISARLSHGPSSSLMLLHLQNTLAVLVHVFAAGHSSRTETFIMAAQRVAFA